MPFKQTKQTNRERLMSEKEKTNIGIIFSGGPAPAANAVISSVALSFLDNGFKVFGLYNGYKHLEGFDKDNPALIKDKHYVELTRAIGSYRNKQGIIIGTARVNPGKDIKNPDDLKDNNKTKKLNNVIKALKFLNVGLLISIGGDDTLRTANLLYNLGMPVIHIPKTIDNDYYGIPWTFGFWTSVNVAQKIILNLKSDAEATGSYFVAEVMGRKAGWLTYAAGIAGEAIKMIALEDLPEGNGDINIDNICNDIVDSIIKREKDGLKYGVICIAEGLVDRLPDYLRPQEKDPFGHTILAKAEIGKVIANGITRFYQEKTGNPLKVISKQVGYETRTAPPISYDVLLGSVLGYGAFKLMDNNKIGHMVSVEDNLNVIGIPFEELINPTTLKARVRPVPKDGDFYHLKKALTYRHIEK